MIPKELIEKEVNEFHGVYNYKFAFEKGVEFAEEYLKDLAVNFHDLVQINCTWVSHDYYKYLNKFYHTSELFGIYSDSILKLKV